MQAVNSTEQAWDLFQSDLRASVGNDRYQRWLKNIILVNSGQDSWTIGTPNRFVLEWLESRYMDEINGAVERVLGRPVQVSLTVSGQLFKRRPLPQKTPKERPGDKTSGRPHRYLNLDTFIPGQFNKTAHRAVLHVLRESKTVFNPLLVLGSSGIGKTHLLQGLVHAYQENNPRLKAHYVCSDEFCYGFRTSLRQKSIKKFRHYYRSLDLLVVDDFQLMIRKTKTQLEFLHTFDTLLNKGKKIVIASNAHPGDIQDLSNPLKQRLVSGLVVRLRTPCLKTRQMIIHNESRRLKRKFTADVVAYLASRFNRNIRELIGAVTRLAAYASLERCQLDLAATQKLLAGQFHELTPEDIKANILQVAGQHFDLTPADLCGASRKRRIVQARKLAIYLMRTYLNISLRDIGDALGGRKAPTIRSAVRDIEKQMKSQDEMRAMVKRLAHNLGLEK